jgi:hypothetical protein
MQVRYKRAAIAVRFSVAASRHRHMHYKLHLDVTVAAADRECVLGCFVCCRTCGVVMCPAASCVCVDALAGNQDTTTAVWDMRRLDAPVMRLAGTGGLLSVHVTPMRARFTPRFACKLSGACMPLHG